MRYATSGATTISHELHYLYNATGTKALMQAVNEPQCLSAEGSRQLGYSGTDPKADMRHPEAVR